MKKFFYVLMASGYRTGMVLFGKQIACPKMKAVYYSQVKHVYARDMQHAEDQVRDLLNKKWLGFIMLKEEMVKNAKDI